jgi:ribosomal protein S18 acetylase RimI-like enzyme
MAGGAGLDLGELGFAELDTAVELWRACGLTRPWNDPHADARRALEGPASTILAGRVGGRLAATAMVGADGHRAWVYYLAVAPDLRGAGYGAAMMRAVEAWARARGMPKLELMVRDENAAAAGFYEAIGYVREPVRVYARRLDPPAA